MGIRALEAAILKEARAVSGKAQLRQKDIMEWSTGEIMEKSGEVKYYLPSLKVHVAVLKTGGCRWSAMGLS